VLRKILDLREMKKVIKSVIQDVHSEHTCSWGNFDTKSFSKRMSYSKLLQSDICNQRRTFSDSLPREHALYRVKLDIRLLHVAHHENARCM
jgi:hypothetical protein